MKEISEREWFQGQVSCGVNHLPLRGNGSVCLWVNIINRSQEVQQELTKIVRVLFPERTCNCLGNAWLDYPSTQLIHFNNHPDTTLDQVNKVISTWRMDHEGA